MMSTPDRHGDGKDGTGPKDEPAGSGQGGDDKHDRHEDASHLVGQALQRGLGPLCLLDETDDLGQGRVGANPRRAEQKRAGLVERRADDLIVDRLVHRQALTGQHALVQRGATLDDHAIDGHLFTRGGRGPGR